jgi:hypothetical protein
MRPDSYKEFSPNIIWEKIIRIIYTQYGIIHVSRLIFAGSFASKRWPGIFLSPFLLQVPLAVLKRFSILTIPDNLQVTVSAQSINFHVTHKPGFFLKFAGSSATPTGLDASHSSISESGHPMRFGVNCLGFGKSPALTRRQIVTAERPVLSTTSFFDSIATNTTSKLVGISSPAPCH